MEWKWSTFVCSCFIISSWIGDLCHCVTFIISKRSNVNPISVKSVYIIIFNVFVFIYRLTVIILFEKSIKLVAIVFVRIKYCLLCWSLCIWVLLSGTSSESTPSAFKRGSIRYKVFSGVVLGEKRLEVVYRILKWDVFAAVIRVLKIT